MTQTGLDYKKVISDILDENVFYTDIESAGKMTHMKPRCSSQLKVFTFLSKKINKMSKTNLITKLLFLQK